MCRRWKNKKGGGSKKKIDTTLAIIVKEFVHACARHRSRLPVAEFRAIEADFEPVFDVWCVLGGFAWSDSNKADTMIDSRGGESMTDEQDDTFHPRGELSMQQKLVGGGDSHLLVWAHQTDK